MVLLGQLVGSTLAIMILTLIVERFAFRNKKPTDRASWTVGIALLIASVIAGFGFADGGPFAWWAGLFYIPGATVVWFFYRRRLIKAWHTDETDTFA